MANSTTVSGVVLEPGQLEVRGRQGQFQSRVVVIEAQVLSPANERHDDEFIKVVIPVKFEGATVDEIDNLREGDKIQVDVQPWGFRAKDGRVWGYHRALPGAKVGTGAVLDEPEPQETPSYEEESQVAGDGDDNLPF